jgi:hypothetical protein
LNMRVAEKSVLKIYIYTIKKILLIKETFFFSVLTKVPYKFHNIIGREMLEPRAFLVFF